MMVFKLVNSHLCWNPKFHEAYPCVLHNTNLHSLNILVLSSCILLDVLFHILSFLLFIARPIISRYRHIQYYEPLTASDTNN